MVDPAIRYQVFIREERFRKDRRPKADAELYLYDDSFEVRIYQMTSEGQWEQAAIPALTLVLAGLIPIFLFMRQTE